MKKMMGLTALVFGAIGTIFDAYAIIQLTQNWNKWLSEETITNTDLSIDAIMLTFFMIISLFLLMLGYLIVKNDN